MPPQKHAPSAKKRAKAKCKPTAKHTKQAPQARGGRALKVRRLPLMPCRALVESHR